ncbi:AMP-binding protein [Sporolactobacillus sp. CPB3-1]|uniref:AMP-binding protein n=1 Tax=Sporolactobacillus mangiferae TaxID=2940498 RepID=A0ABT0M687_9BACL|nr:AMP-binding protein [Sporolactobacillus mangiferae]MCL1630352.1 AMP-binding protein [Sporolactobacillus mangiferae]
MKTKRLNSATRYTDFREMIYASARKFGKKSAFQIKKKDGNYRYVTYAQFKEEFKALGTHFLDLGLHGRRIAVIGKNSYDWVLHYTCAATVGVAVPIDRELSPEDIYQFIVSADCAAICADSEILEQLRPILRSKRLLLSLQDDRPFIPARDDTRLDMLPIAADTMSVLLFTSGTSGNPKGVCLSQKNICANIFSTSQIVKVTPRDKTLSILPLCHTYECTLNCLLILSRGACIAYADSLNAIRRNILEYRPTLLIVVPALLQLLDQRIHAAILKNCPAKYRSKLNGSSIGMMLQTLPVLVRMIIRRKVKKSLGGRIHTFIVGGADLSPAVVEDFLALDIRALQGYGLTESAPLLAGNNDFYFNAKSTGVAIPGVELMIDNPNEAGVGEILAKGDNIMLGYYNAPEATANAFCNGYFRTGDLGFIDKDGALYIKGRMKNVIVTANGKNIYPEELEARLLEKETISEALILTGNDRHGDICVKAKIFPDLEGVAKIIGHLPTKEEIQAMIKSIVEEVNNKMPDYKHIRMFEIIEREFEKTTTRKIRRYGMNLT